MIGSSFGTSWSKTYNEAKIIQFEPRILFSCRYMKKKQTLAFLSIFSHATVSLMLYRSPKNHVSLSPRVRHTRSKRSFPFHFTYRTKQPEISTSWSALAGKFPPPSLPKFDIITFHHKLSLPVQSLSCSPHPAEACDREYQTHKPFLERFHLKTWADSRCNSRLVWETANRNQKKREDEAGHAAIDHTHVCAFLPIFALKGYFQNL